MFIEMSIMIVIMFIVQASVAKIVNYDRNTSIVQTISSAFDGVPLLVL